MKILKNIKLISALFLAVLALGLNTQTEGVFAGTTSPQSTDIGIQGEIPSNPPARGATIAVPSNGASFSSLPITVSGTCPNGLLVKVFSNGVFMGSAICSNGSYSVQISLFAGQNALTAIDYDALSQAGPTSNTVNVTYNNAQYAQYGTQLTLTSNYAELGAAPGTQLVWPVIISGGTAPYAISIDWGDGTASVLMSEAHEGVFNMTHTYQVSGVYKVIVKATDNKGETAILQLVGQATGAIAQSSGSNNKNGSSSTTIITKLIIWPAIAMLPLIPLAFWAGRRHHIRSLQINQRKYEAARAGKPIDTKP